MWAVTKDFKFYIVRNKNLFLRRINETTIRALAHE